MFFAYLSPMAGEAELLKQILGMAGTGGLSAASAVNPYAAAANAFPQLIQGGIGIAQAIKAQDPRIVTVLGGGFVNTELRELAEPRVFDCFDHVTLDQPGDVAQMALPAALVDARCAL